MEARPGLSSSHGGIVFPLYSPDKRSPPTTTTTLTNIECGVSGIESGASFVRDLKRRRCGHNNDINCEEKNSREEEEEEEEESFIELERNIHITPLKPKRKREQIEQIEICESCEDAERRRKKDHKPPSARDIPKARLVFLRFCNNPVELVPAKILYKEPWGVQVQVLEECISIVGVVEGARFWAKFSGSVTPGTNQPILEAIHST